MRRRMAAASSPAGRGPIRATSIERLRRRCIDRALALEAICDRYGVPLAAAALQFSLRDPRISVTIAGMSRPERIQADARASVARLFRMQLWDEIDALGTTGLPGSVDVLARQLDRLRMRSSKERTMGTELLNRRKFGNTSLEVPSVAMGCAPLGDMPESLWLWRSRR